MLYTETALVAYLVDRIFGEFRFVRHPVVLMGYYIKYYEKHFYKYSILSGAILVFSLVTITLMLACLIAITSLLPSTSYLLLSPKRYTSSTFYPLLFYSLPSYAKHPATTAPTPATPSPPWHTPSVSVSEALHDILAR